MSETILPSLDEEALQRLRELDPSGKNRLVERVMDAFETSTARLSSELERARGAGNVAAIGVVAHTLKSSSASIGALVLARLCAEIEAETRQRPGAALAGLLAAMDQELALVLQAVRATLETSRGMQA